MNFLIEYPSVAVTLVLVIGLTVRWFALPTDRNRTEWLLAVSTLAVPATAAAELFAFCLSHLRPLKYDEYVYRIDGIFGEPSFLVGRIVAHHRWLIILVSVSYGLLPIAIIGTFAVYVFFRSERESLRVFWTFLLNLFVAVPIYLLFPVCGPQFAFRGFPFHLPAHLVPHMLSISAAPNGVPSVHTSSAILVLWFLWPWRTGKVIGIAFLALTILATLGSGQHYLFDLGCAVPYSALIVWLGKMEWLSGAYAFAKQRPVTEPSSGSVRS